MLTLQCLYFLAENTSLDAAEIIVVDNGSSEAAFALLARHGNGVRIIRLDANLGFGEANNIAAEQAEGDVLVFLNNDAMVRAGWLDPLLHALAERDDVGAAGAKLIHPDGMLQEAGATISACGTAVQRGKRLGADLPLFRHAEVVDYCSAAALAVRADAFRRVLGFDLCWDPAYYEDADLCLKLRGIGLATLYVPGSVVVHIEHATSADQALGLHLQDIVEINRLKFVERWGGHLAGLEPGPSVRPAARNIVATQRPGLTSVFYTPFPLTPGGGERYLLTMAALMSRWGRCIVATPVRNSRSRLLTLGRELGIDLDAVEIMPLADVGTISIDLFVCMANQALPPLDPRGRVNLYHCQFPFPMDEAHLRTRWHYLAGYQAVLVNSHFTATAYEAAVAAIGLTPPPIHLLSPPVPQTDVPSGFDRPDFQILSVGRFSAHGHCKRQDRMIEAFRRMVAGRSPPVTLHLAGAVGSHAADRAYFRDLIAAAKGLPVQFHPNPSAAAIARLRRQATLYWHLTGADDDAMLHPERFEHFGIALCEAMAAGVVPVALAAGGPAEIIRNDVDGVLIDDPAMIDRASAVLLTEPERLRRLAAAAAARAQDFRPNAFARTLHDILRRVGVVAAGAVASPEDDGGS